MKRYTPDELTEVMRLHKLWLAGEEGGSRADLSGADLYGVKVAAIRAFSGLYEYQCQAVISVEGVPWIRMGCLWKSLEDWDSIGIRKSNVSEFPDDGSEKSERRARAFDYVRSEVLVMAEKFKAGRAA